MGFIGSIIGCCCFLLFTVGLALVGFFMYIHLQNQFPDDLKNVEPQLFKSHPARNLQSRVTNLTNVKYNFFNESLISKCQDFQIATNGDIYCVNEKSHVIKINPNNGHTQLLHELSGGSSYGNRLSRDQTKLYFINSLLGLCEYDIQKRQLRQLVSEFQGNRLLSLNSIQTHPEDSNILFITQSTTKLHMNKHIIDIILNNPFGRLFEFNITSGQLKLITDSLYFPNGVVYQVVNNESTLLVAETNRHRVIRVYLQGQKRGQKQIAINKLDLFIDNMKLSKSGELWIAGPTLRNMFNQISDRVTFLRRIISRLPVEILAAFADTKYFGGIKVSFNKNNKTEYDLKYYLYRWKPQFTFVTTLVENENKLFMSSLVKDGLLVVDLQSDTNGNAALNERIQEQL